jgi:hypothetical protein
MGRIRIEGALYMQTEFDEASKKVQRAQYTTVVLSNAKIEEKISLEGAEVKKELDLVNARVGGNLSMGTRRFSDGPHPGCFLHVKAGGTTIKGDLDITGSTIGALDLTAAAVDKVFRLGPAMPGAPTTCDVGNSNEIKVRHMNVGEISADFGGWPEKLDITGFKYGSAISFWKATDRSKATDYFLDLLSKQTDFSRQPYEHLAMAFQREGYRDVGDEILYAGRERERQEEWKNGRYIQWVWLSMQKALIGFGYKPWWSFYWVVFFVLLGAAIFRNTRAARERRMPWGVAYSFDMLLPLITLREMHKEIPLSGWQRYYFYAHKLVGYVLALFVGAALAGLTK